MKKYRIHIPPHISQEPEAHEKVVAQILADYFQHDVFFIDKGPLCTPDIEINHVIWETKSPKGNSKRTMQNNLRKADDQSVNVVIDLHRTKMSETRAISRIRHEIERASKIKRLLVVTKKNKVLVIK